MNATLIRCYEKASRFLSYLTLMWLPLVACVHRAAAGLVPLIMLLSRPRITRHKCLWLFVGWCVLSLFWAPNPSRAWHVAVCVALFLLLRPTRHWEVSTIHITAAVVLATAIQTSLIMMGAAHKNPALLYAPVSLTISLVCAAYPSWLVIACSFWLGWIVDCDTALLATAGVAVARYMPFGLLKHSWKILWITVCLGLIGVSNLTDQHIQTFEKASPSFSYIHRLYIYREMTKLIQEQPITQQIMGFGLDASRIVGQKKFTFTTSSKNVHTSDIIPLHPHNILLQIVIELGWFGLALFGFCLWQLPLRRKEEALVFYVVACHALVSVGVWQTWWIASSWLAYWLASIKHDV